MSGNRFNTIINKIFDVVTKPNAWPTILRRLYIIFFPITIPLQFLFLLLTGILGTFCLFFLVSYDWLKDIWNGK